MPNHTSNTKENGLEALIVKWLVEQNGYEQGTNADYNREYAVDETRLFRFLQDTQPDAPREPPHLSKIWRTSLAVRFRLSVTISTMTATPQGAYPS